MKATHQDILKGSDLFSGLREAEIEQLAKLVRLVHLDAGEMLFLKGDPGAKIYIVAKGIVRICVASSSGRETILNHIKEGQVFGEIAAISGGTRTTDAVAVTKVELLSMDHGPLLAFLSTRPEACLLIMTTLCDRLRWVSELLEDHHFLDANARLAKRLLVLARLFGEKVQGGIRITLKLSQKDLANYVGITRERANRFLKKWQDDGVISQNAGYFVLLDQERLAEVANTL